MCWVHSSLPVRRLFFYPNLVSVNNLMKDQHIGFATFPTFSLHNLFIAVSTASLTPVRISGICSPFPERREMEVDGKEDESSNLAEYANANVIMNEENVMLT
jgi:hypothetical protein